MLSRNKMSTSVVRSPQFTVCRLKLESRVSCFCKRRTILPAAVAGAQGLSEATTETVQLQQIQVTQRKPRRRGQSETYPFIDTTYPGLEMVHADPPVYVVHNFLQPGHCHALQQAALSNQLPPTAYNDAVLFDYHRLAYLSLVIGFGGTSQALQAHLQEGSTWLNICQAAVSGVALWTCISAVLAAAVKAAVEWKTNGKCFTGSKWSAKGMQPGSPAAEARDAFVQGVCSLLDTDPTKLEIPLVTRYCKGEYQRVHFDARPPGDSQGASDWLAAGGQRLVQCVVYLNDMDCTQGGATKFHHHCFGGLEVQPEQGAVLVFFPAFADGSVDGRMAHSGEAVLEGEKWILNTWAMQYSKPDEA